MTDKVSRGVSIEQNNDSIRLAIEKKTEQYSRSWLDRLQEQQVFAGDSFEAYMSGKSITRSQNTLSGTLEALTQTREASKAGYPSSPQ